MMKHKKLLTIIILIAGFICGSYYFSSKKMYDSLLENNKFSGTEEINIALDEKKIQFTFDHLLIQSRLLDGLFPETKRLIPTSFVTEIKTPMQPLVRAIDRASFIKSEGVSTVKLDIISDEVVITNMSQEMGSFKESITVDEFNGEPLKISFSSRFMLEALRSLNTLDVEIKFAGDMRPFLIVDPNDDSVVQLVLPVRSYD